jgi:hypothetical protein|tara:strand:+ start:796 stop:972 length:177 start_codon:yes stop_codon:yes gene_type:complete
MVKKLIHRKKREANFFEIGIGKKHSGENFYYNTTKHKMFTTRNERRLFKKLEGANNDD